MFWESSKSKKERNLLSELKSLPYDPKFVEKVHIPKSRAVLCANCQEIYHLSLPNCPACGSRASYFIGVDKPKLTPKLAIVGFGRSGKDTAAEVIAAHSNLKYDGRTGSTSGVILSRMLTNPRYAGLSREEVYSRRLVDRELWYEVGREICNHEDDAAGLVKECLRTGNIVVGIRSAEELKACRQERLFDSVIWIDGGSRVPVDTTVHFGRSDCDLVIENHGTLEEFKRKLIAFAKCLR